MTMSDIEKPRERVAARILPNGEVEMTVWTRRGKMLVRRDALDVDDPGHPLAVLEGLGLDPDAYGYAEARLRRDAKAFALQEATTNG